MFLGALGKGTLNVARHTGIAGNLLAALVFPGEKRRAGGNHGRIAIPYASPNGNRVRCCGQAGDRVAVRTGAIQRLPRLPKTTPSPARRGRCLCRYSAPCRRGSGHPTLATSRRLAPLTAAVHLVEIDVVGFEQAQRCFALLDDMAAAVAGGRRMVVAHATVYLFSTVRSRLPLALSAFPTISSLRPRL